jgi:hypothetical protein
VCQEGADIDLSLRYEREWLAEGQELNNIYLEYLRSHVEGKTYPYKNNTAFTGIEGYARPKVCIYTYNNRHNNTQ